MSWRGYASMNPSSWKRRQVNGLLDDFHGYGIDVGAGREPAPWWKLPALSGRGLRVDAWDQKDGDAHRLEGVANWKYDFLFASHVLEHLEHPSLALQNWVRVVRPGGVLLIAVPHRDLYEGRRQLPSKWNPEHKRFYLPDRNDGSHTVGLLPWLQDWEERMHFQVLAVQTGDWGYTAEPGEHPAGEFQIDALLHRRL